jgi:hypothetical protein
MSLLKIADKGELVAIHGLQQLEEFQKLTELLTRYRQDLFEQLQHAEGRQIPIIQGQTILLEEQLLLFKNLKNILENKFKKKVAHDTY